MKVYYRGHEINVRRETSLGGWKMIYYSIFRIADGYECTSGFTEDDSLIKTFIKYMKKRIDNELTENDPWGERAKNA